MKNSEDPLVASFATHADVVFSPLQQVRGHPPLAHDPSGT